MTKKLGAWTVSGVNKFAWKFQSRNHHTVPYYRPISEEKVAPSEKVTLSEEVEKVTKMLDDIEYPVVMIGRKKLDNFQGQSRWSTGWFNIYFEWLREKNSTPEPDFYKTF